MSAEPHLVATASDPLPRRAPIAIVRLRRFHGFALSAFLTRLPTHLRDALAPLAHTTMLPEINRDRRTHASSVALLDCANHDGLIWGAFGGHGRELVGVAQLVFDAGLMRSAALLLYVAPEWRARGIGRRLLTALERAARSHSVRTLRAQIEAVDPEVADFFRRRGYRIAAVRNLRRSMTAAVKPLASGAEGGVGWLLQRSAITPVPHGAGRSVP